MSCGKGSAGRKGKPYISIDGGVAFLVISSSKDMNLKKAMSPIDVTSFDSINGWKEQIEGLKDWSISNEAIYLEADAGQEDLLNAIDVGTELVFQYRPLNQSGAQYFEGTVLVTEWNIKNGVADAVMVSASFVGCGQPQTKILP
jgi:predicted secreted protein